MSWPTVEEVDAQPGRLWWVDGQPETLVADWAAPPSVYWVRRGEAVADLPVRRFGGPVLTPAEVDALTSRAEKAGAEARRILLALADAADRESSSMWRELADALGVDMGPPHAAARPIRAKLAAALRKVCGVSDG